MSLKTVAEMLGYELKDEKDFKEEDFKEYVDKNYVLRENAAKDDDIKSKVTGKVLGSLGTKAAQIFGLKSGEVDGKKIEEVLELAKNKWTEEVKAIKESVPKSDDEKVKKLEKELENERTAAGTLQKSIEEWEGKYNKDIGDLTGHLKNVKLAQKVRDAKSKVQFTDDYHNNELTREGFDTLIGKKYKLDLNEKDELIVTNADGTSVRHPKKASQAASFEDVLAIEAEANNLLKKNDAPPTTVKRIIKSGDGEQEFNQAKVHPKAVLHAQKLQETRQ